MDPITDTLHSQDTTTSSITIVLESDIESAAFGLSSEIFKSSVDSEELGSDSMHEYEESPPTDLLAPLVGAESNASIAGAFTFTSDSTTAGAFTFTSDSTTAGACTFTSDSSAKRYKSSSSSMSGENDTQVFSGFKTGSDKRVYIDQQRVQEAAAEMERCLIEEHTPVIQDTDGVQEIHDSEPDGIGLGQDEPQLVESGFTTGNSKPILIDLNKLRIESQLIESGFTADSSKPISKDEPQLVESGFTTGNSKPILIDLNKLRIESQLAESGFTADSSKPISKDEPNLPVSIEMPEHTQSTDKMTSVYQNAIRHFKKEEGGWIFEHFKWSWLHLYLNNEINGLSDEELLAKVIEVMELKRRHERSILRRIVEFDDASFRFMTLGVIGYCKEYIELFDGFYSLRFEIDENIHTFLKRSYCGFGTKLLVFGCKLLLKEATSIFDIKECPLKLSYNGLRVGRRDSRLGRARQISFLNTISAIRPDGGTVSGLNVKIDQILEQKYLVTIANYTNRVSDLEAELEKIHALARSTGNKIEPNEVAVRPYCKVLVSDGTGMCVLTWWSPPELRAGERYMIVYLNTTEWGGRLELATTRMTYYRLIK